MPTFLLYALLAGSGVALVAGPLGAFVVWRRMAFFGDTLAHAALLGVALGLALGLDVNLAVAALCLAVAMLIVLLERQRALAADTVLGLLAHASLSLGLIALALVGSVRVDLLAVLFGDVLAVTAADLAWIYGAGSAALLLLLRLWRPLLSMTVSEEIARVEGVEVGRVRLAFMLMLALVIAAAIKVVGLLLITSLLVIPAATARRFSRTPETMAALAALAGVAAVAGGLGASWGLDTPAGPSIVVAAAALFAASLLAPAPGGGVRALVGGRLD